MAGASELALLSVRAADSGNHSGGYGGAQHETCEGLSSIFAIWRDAR
jgi:hypothetical protein